MERPYVLDFQMTSAYFSMYQLKFDNKDELGDWKDSLFTNGIWLEVLMECRTYICLTMYFFKDAVNLS